MTAAKHHADLILCRKQPGIAVGRLCEKCDGKCPVCDSTVAPTTLVHICDECNYGSNRPRAASNVANTSTMLSSGATLTQSGKCVICNGPGVADAFYCRQCTLLEKDVKFLIITRDHYFINPLFSFFVERRLPEDCQFE